MFSHDLLLLPEPSPECTESLTVCAAADTPYMIPSHPRPVHQHINKHISDEHLSVSALPPLSELLFFHNQLF